MPTALDRMRAVLCESRQHVHDDVTEMFCLTWAMSALRGELGPHALDTLLALAAE